MSKSTPTELSIMDRLVIDTILEMKGGNRFKFYLAETIRSEVRCTPEQLESVGFKLAENGNGCYIKDQEKAKLSKAKFKLGKAALGLIVEQFKALEKIDALSKDMVDLYDRLDPPPDFEARLKKLNRSDDEED